MSRTISFVDVTGCLHEVFIDCTPPTQRKEHDIACKANTIEIRRLVPEPNRVVQYTCFVCKGFPNIQNSAHLMFQIIQLMYVLGPFWCFLLFLCYKSGAIHISTLTEITTNN